MSPSTSAQQAFLDQMRLNRTDERAMRILEAAFLSRNNQNQLRPGPADSELQEVCDKVAG